MSRREGTLKLSSNIEPRASAPLDARLVVPTLADLTASGAFPYPYVGMIVSVQAEGKAYMLTASDPTVSANWTEIGSGSGESIQVTTLPTASIDELGNIYQYVGESGTYINGYFYECVSDGESTPTYSWEQKNVQPSKYKSVNFLTMTGAKYQCITGLKLGGAYLIEISYNMFIVKVLDNFGDQSQKKYGFEIELLGQNLNDTTNAFYNYPVYLNNFEDNALAPILAIYVSNGDRTNIRVTQISGVENNDFDFGTFYTSTPPVPFKKSTFYSAASMREAIAPLFNDNKSYNVGDIVWKRVNTNAYNSRVHDNIELYRCIVAHSGSWSSAHFEKIQLCKDFKSGSKVFSGTMDEWDALTETEKVKYDFIATPDEAVEDIADAIIDGDMRAITSNAVAQVIPSDASSSNKLVTVADITPVGVILPYGGLTAPNNWFFCRGQAVSRTIYSELFAVIGTAFGDGDGSTTFNLPDMREVVPVGIGQNGTQTIETHDVYTLAEFKDDQLQDHRHTITPHVSVAHGDYSTAFSYDTPEGSGGSVTVGRHGTTTHGKQLGVNYIIKAT